MIGIFKLKHNSVVEAIFEMLFRSVKLLLKEYLATLGIQIPDGRSRK
jgi:hypothetical protein